MLVLDGKRGDLRSVITIPKTGGLRLLSKGSRGGLLAEGVKCGVGRSSTEETASWLLLLLLRLLLIVRIESTKGCVGSTKHPIGRADRMSSERIEARLRGRGRGGRKE